MQLREHSCLQESDVCLACLLKDMIAEPLVSSDVLCGAENGEEFEAGISIEGLLALLHNA